MWTKFWNYCVPVPDYCRSATRACPSRMNISSICDPRVQRASHHSHYLSIRNLHSCTTRTAGIGDDTNRRNTFSESTVTASKLASFNMRMTDGGIEAAGVGNRSDKTPRHSVVPHCAQLTHILPAGRHLLDPMST